VLITDYHSVSPPNFELLVWSWHH